MPSKAHMQQRLNEMSSIIAEQAARIEALENEVATILLANAKKTRKTNKVSHSQLNSWECHSLLKKPASRASEDSTEAKCHSVLKKPASRAAEDEIYILPSSTETKCHALLKKPAAEDETLELQSSTEVLTEAERLTRHLLVDIEEWHSLERFRASRLVRNKFGAGCVRLAFRLLAENGIVDVHNQPTRTRNRPVTTIMKRPWSRIDSDPKGRRFLKRLRVNRDAFE